MTHFALFLANPRELESIENDFKNRKRLQKMIFFKNRCKLHNPIQTSKTIKTSKTDKDLKK